MVEQNTTNLATNGNNEQAVNTESKLEEKETQSSPQPMVINTPKKKNKAGTIILVVLLILLLLCIICAGITFFAVKSFKYKAMNQLQQGLNDAKKSSDLMVTPTSSIEETPSGSYTTDGKLPTGFPSDMPIYPNAKITFSTTESGQQVVNLTTEDSGQKVVDYYKTELPAKGWKIDNQLNILGTVFSVSKGNNKGSVTILGDESGASLILSVGK